eukprot:GFYU01011596.1.p1 GENE.GFYU01011596.1~~GFYU01011596.1.p1  ORF type:complete len:234 (-),score=32.78 GFYU01011596.1:419-1021(-)
METMVPLIEEWMLLQQRPERLYTGHEDGSNMPEWGTMGMDDDSHIDQLRDGVSPRRYSMQSAYSGDASITTSSSNTPRDTESVQSGHRSDAMSEILSEFGAEISAEKEDFMRRVSQTKELAPGTLSATMLNDQPYFNNGFVYMRRHGTWEYPLHDQLSKPKQLNRQELLIVSDVISSLSEVMSILSMPFLVGGWHYIPCD